MRTADDIAAAIRRTATRAADPVHSKKLHRLADEAGAIRSVRPRTVHRA
ncbi:hypothetical protein K3172_12835 [Qipengyuania sp. 6B39]|nr:hypothetical protein [Qipengyuania proteolytica]MBX7496744.1 hypothetical protein [Qipengyuania proteolytica]